MSSLRRMYLDRLLEEHKLLYHGTVVDFGGKKISIRGSFRPPFEKCSKWFYVNIDPDIKPDFINDITKISIKKGSVDVAIFCEVVEHLAFPEIAVKNILETLKSNGVLIMSSPFLYPYHADPYDFQRWTKRKLETQFPQEEYSSKILQMGGLIAVVYDILLIGLHKAGNNWLLKLTRMIISKLLKIVFYLDRKFHVADTIITTGYFIVVKKK